MVGRPPKLEPLKSFESNLQDAQVLLAYSRALSNNRQRAMRTELRDRLGQALRVPRTERVGLDCLENDQLFVVLKPNSELSRSDFVDLRPLLRQALVAGCAAFETYLADKAMERIGPLLRSDLPPRKLEDISLTVGQWRQMDQTYQRPVWGVRSIVEGHLRTMSSTSPSQVGKVLSTVGAKNWASTVDRRRAVKGGTTCRQLEQITERRNRIVHSADRLGSGRARFMDSEVDAHIGVLAAVATAIEELVDDLV